METGVTIAANLAGIALKPIIEEMKDWWPEHCLKEGDQLIFEVEEIVRTRGQYIPAAERKTLQTLINEARTAQLQLQHKSGKSLLLSPILYIRKAREFRQTSEYAHATARKSAIDSSLAFHLNGGMAEHIQITCGTEAHQTSSGNSTVMISNTNVQESGEAILTVSSDVLDGRSGPVTINNMNTAKNGSAVLELECPASGGGVSGKIIINNCNSAEGGSARVVVKGQPRLLRRIATLSFRRRHVSDDTTISDTVSETPQLCRKASMTESIISDSASFHTACEGNVDADSDSDEATLNGGDDGPQDITGNDLAGIDLHIFESNPAE
ncbi:unnamed protein product [Somion occarium]|uniref:Uncharacterized protein n=1 Tax=Somion occarium TaxID=3059160 RepID=A0ABP1DEP0_9APHY